MINYKKPELHEMDKIANLHMECFKGYFLSSFGVEIVKKYYEEFFKEKELFIVAEDEDGNCIGFVMGYLSGSVARKNFERKYRRVLTIKLLLRCFKCDKMAILKCIEKVKGFLKRKKGNKKPEKKTGDLLSICVASYWRGCGVAEGLVKNFEELLAKDGVKEYTLSVRKDNKGARKFYEKVGFYLLKEGKEDVKYIKKVDATKN